LSNFYFLVSNNHVDVFFAYYAFMTCAYNAKTWYSITDLQLLKYFLTCLHFWVGVFLLRLSSSWDGDDNFSRFQRTFYHLSLFPNRCFPSVVVMFIRWLFTARNIFLKSIFFKKSWKIFLLAGDYKYGSQILNRLRFSRTFCLCINWYL